MRDFPRQYIPPRAQSPESHNKLSALLQERDRIESDLETLHTSINPDGSSTDPNCDIDKEYIPMRDAAYAVNRSMYQAYVEFLEPLKDTRSMRIRTTTRKDGGTLDSRRHFLEPYNPSADKDPNNQSAKDLSAAIRQRIAIQSVPSTTASSSTHDTAETSDKFSKPKSSHTGLR
jgi:hypothetical protein